jgi:hypothetical protein
MSDSEHTLPVAIDIELTTSPDAIWQDSAGGADDVQSKEVRVNTPDSPMSAADNASALTSPATTTLIQDNDKCFTKQLSFEASDAFFHGMLSYRVNSEGPSGNDLALLLWESCSQRGISSRQNSKGDLAIQRSIDVVNQFGKWPRIFPHPSSSGVRIFLDQKNLRPGFDWKGTGNRADGGFLGALSSSLMLVPLLSATPARFNIKSAGSDDRFQFTERGNFAILEQKPLDIFCGLQVTVCRQMALVRKDLFLQC